MAKQDVLDAINATIVENGQKGITAQSLNNVLTMMTENAGEGGSSDGALRIIVPEIGFFGFMMVNLGEFTPTSWAAIKLEFEGEGYDLSEYDAVVNASFVHNANVAKQLLEKVREGQGVSVILDQTPFSSAVFNCLKQNNPEFAVVYDDFVFSGVQPAALFVHYQKVTPEGVPVLDGKDEIFDCFFIPFNGIGEYEVSLLYPSITIALSLDGSLTFDPIPEEQPSSGNGVVTFYADIDGGELSDEYKAKNVSSFNTFKVGCPVTIIGIVSGNEVVTLLPMSVSFNVMDESGLKFLACIFPTKTASGSDAEILFSEDGSTMVRL